MLSRRELSRVELTARLLDRGFAREDVDAAVERLAGQPFCRRPAGGLRARAHRQPAQRTRADCGFSASSRRAASRANSTREALAEIPPDEDDVNAIKRFVERKGRTVDDTPAGRRRLFNQLLRRGFPRR